MAKAPPDEIRKRVREGVDALRQRRRDLGLCVQDARHERGQPHESPTRQKRRSDGGFELCEACYQAKLAAKRRGNDA